MIRKLRVLAAFSMIPLVLFGNSTTAAAAGPWTPVHITGGLLPDDVPVVGLECQMNVQQFGAGSSALNVGTNGYCVGGPDTTPGYTQPGEAGSTLVLTVTGTTPTGSACSGTSTQTLGEHSGNGTIRTAGSIPGGPINTSAPDCSISEVCMSWPTWGANDSESCTDVSIPALTDEGPDEGSSCMYGQPSVESREKVTPYMNGVYIYGHEVRATITPSAGGESGRWGMTTYWLPVGSTTVLQGYSVHQFTGSDSGWVVSGPEDFKGGATAPPSYNIVGVELKALPLASDQMAGELNLAGKYADTYPAVQGVNRYGGLTEPQNCRFWIGPKVVDFPGTEADEPGGSVNDVVQPPTEDPEPVVDPPPVIDEPDEGYNWLAAIWAMLKSIGTAIVNGFQAVVSAVHGIASAIVDGISDLLDGLFLPDDGFLESKWTGVESKWSGTSPGRYVDALEGLSSGSVSGCSGLPLNVSLPGGVQVDEHIGAACSGTMASAAGMTRAALTAVFAVGGAIACVRAVGSGLGWNPGIGRGGDSA